MEKNSIHQYEVVDAPTPEDFWRILKEGGRVSFVVTGDATIEVDIEKAHLHPESDVVTFLGNVASICNLPTSDRVFGRVDLMVGHGFLKEVSE